MPFNRAVAVDEGFNLPGPVLARLREELRVQRTTTVVMASSAISAGTRHLGTMIIGSEFQLISVTMSHAKARLRLYVSGDKRAADLMRTPGTDPQGAHGLILDIVSTDSALFPLSPQVIGATLPGEDHIYYALDNVDTVPAIITATIVSRQLD